MFLNFILLTLLPVLFAAPQGNSRRNQPNPQPPAQTCPAPVTTTSVVTQYATVTGPATTVTAPALPTTQYITTTAVSTTTSFSTTTTTATAMISQSCQSWVPVTTYPTPSVKPEGAKAGAAEKRSKQL